MLRLDPSAKKAPPGTKATRCSAMARARAYHGNEDLYVEVAVVKGELILNDIIRIPEVI